MSESSLPMMASSFPCDARLSMRVDGDQQSMVLHRRIAIDAQDGALLGLVHAEPLRRRGGSKAQRKVRPFVEKESRRWLTGAAHAAELLAGGAACVTVIT